MSARTATALREFLKAAGPIPDDVPVGELWASDFFGQLAFIRADKYANIGIDFIELGSDELVEFAVDDAESNNAVGILTFHEKVGPRRTLRYRVLGAEGEWPTSVIAERLFDQA